MRKQSRLFQASLILLLSVMPGMGQMQPASAHPYQVKSEAEYAQEQAHWREMIKRDPQNPEPYLQLGKSLAGEASEGYWCKTQAIAVYREAIAVVRPNAELHFLLGAALVEPQARCDEPPLVTEGSFHLRKAIAIASEKASAESLYKAADLLIQINKEVNP